MVVVARSSPFRQACFAVLLVTCSSRPALAQDISNAAVPPASDSLSSHAISALTTHVTLPPIDPLRMPDLGASRPVAASERPSALVPLYVSFASLQVLDVTSTLRARERGAREANPVVAPLVNSRPALIGMKAGATVAVVYLTERLRKRHRIAAVLLMVGLNAGYVGVVARNYSISGR